jgi:hypothetical protein
MGEPAGTYVAMLTFSDDDGGSVTVDVTYEVDAEDASVSFDLSNPVAELVTGDGEPSGPFSVTVYVEETEPDIASNGALPGDLTLAVIDVRLVPVGPGGHELPQSCALSTTGTGYAAVTTVTCDFDNVPVNTYLVQVTVAGGYYTGTGEDVLSVYDPSLGFTTGGGWFYWPGTDDKTNFGYTMKYNKKGKNLKGSLLLIRHTDSGIYRVKSNALFGLALGSEDGSDPYGWASFSGKSTYREPGWDSGEGNHQFIVYVEDHGTPGAAADRFWIEVRDKDRNVIGDSSMSSPAATNAETLEGGNIVVPHQGGSGGGGSKK